jgi:flavin reductase (DIM6/NTAB) family NADH-FMN oxidoreductase RutF
MNAVAQLPSRTTEAFDTNAFRQALGCFPTGVAIVTTTDQDNTPVGITCNSFSSVSLDPPLVLWSLRTASKSLPIYQKARGFAINVLSGEQSEVSNRFASSAIQDKFEGVDYSLGVSDSPVIGACIATFECRTVAQHVEGDHVIFIGHVERFEHGQRNAPLVFCKGAYATLTESLRELVDMGNIPPQHLHQARSALHDVVVRLACQYGTESDFAALEENLKTLKKCAADSDFVGHSEAALNFFNLIAKAAHNEVLQILTGSLTQIMSQALTSKSAKRFRPELLEIRYELLANLRLRNADAASKAVLAYLNRLQTEG